MLYVFEHLHVATMYVSSSLLNVAPYPSVFGPFSLHFGTLWLLSGVHLRLLFWTSELLWGSFGPPLGAQGPILGPLGVHVGRFGVPCGRFLEPYGPLLVHLSSMLDLFWSTLGPFGPHLDL